MTSVSASQSKDVEPLILLSYSCYAGSVPVWHLPGRSRSSHEILMVQHRTRCVDSFLIFEDSSRLQCPTVFCSHKFVCEVHSLRQVDNSPPRKRFWTLRVEGLVFMRGSLLLNHHVYISLLISLVFLLYASKRRSCKG
jgi:hypothetical protein